MDKNEAENYIIRRPEDDHLHNIIAQRMNLCQKSQAVVIGNVERKADRAHGRIDEVCKDFGERLNRLDDKEVGKVHILWNERNKIIAVGGTLLLAIIINIFVGLMNGNKAVNKPEISDAVKAAIMDLAKNGGK